MHGLTDRWTILLLNVSPEIPTKHYFFAERKTEQQNSNIWPPPQPKQYMKTVKNLPSNIVVSAEGQQDGESVATGSGLVVYRGGNSAECEGKDERVTQQPGSSSAQELGTTGTSLTPGEQDITSKEISKLDNPRNTRSCSLNTQV